MGILRALATPMAGNVRDRRHLVALLLLPMLMLTACATPAAEEPNTAGDPPEAETLAETEASGLPEGIPSYMVKGSPDAPVILYEWSDYQCPYCSRHAEQTSPKIDEAYVDTGQVRVVFRDLPLVSIHEHAQKASEAARCAGEIGGSQAYWDMYHALFETQGEWSGAEDAAPAFKRSAGGIGVDQAAFDACLDEDRHAEAVMADYQEAIGLGIQATPSFVLQGTTLEGALPFEEFQQMLDIVVAGGTLPTPTVPPTPEMVEVPAPFVDVQIGDAPARGDAEAPVTIVEFSDFQCPYCKMFVDQTFATLMSEFVETGRVRYVFRDFPLASIHPAAESAAQAAHCARDQGGDDAYFAMHEALFASQEDWSAAEDPVASFAAMANDLDLDGAALTQCVEDGTHADTVTASFEEATSGLRLGGTPTFVINGQVVPGVLTPEALAANVEAAERGEPITLTLPKEYADQLTPPAPAEE